MKPGIVSISVTILNIRIFPGKKMCIHLIVTTSYDGFFMYNLEKQLYRVFHMDMMDLSMFDI